MSVLSNLKSVDGIFRFSSDVGYGRGYGRRYGLDPSHDSRGKVEIFSCTLYLFRLTAFALMAFSILSSTRQFFGESIECESISSGSVDLNLLKSYCWMSGSYVAPLNYSGGFPKISRLAFQAPKERKRYLNYYQWIPFLFFIQAGVIYAPYIYWKINEGGRVGRLIKIAQSYHKGNKKEESEEEKALFPEDPDMYSLNVLAKMLIRRQGSHNWYTLQYIWSHIMALLSLCLILYGINIMLEGDFAYLGYSLMNLSDTEEELDDFENNTLRRVFPRLIQCKFTQKFGRSGTRETHSSLCILPLNILNEKIFVLIWFWFLFLFAWTIINTILNLLMIICSLPRIFILRYFVQSTRRTPSFAFERLAQVSNYGDWFILLQLKRNLDETSFRILLDEFSKNLTVYSALTQTNNFRYSRHHNHSKIFQAPPLPPPKQPPGPSGDSRPGSPPSIASNRISRV